MTGMPRNFRPIIGRDYAGPPLDRPALRRLPQGWVIEEARRSPAWWRFLPEPGPLIRWMVIFILCYAALDALGSFHARADESEVRIAGKAVAETVKRLQEKPKFPKAAPSYPVWSSRPCPGRTYLASSSDGRAWKTRCTGRLVRS